MATNLVQFRIDETSKIQATIICDKLGIDLQTYIRICIARLIADNSIPFDMVLKDKISKDWDALSKMQKISKENENSEMTLDEINEEIRLSREERNAKNK